MGYYSNFVHSRDPSDYCTIRKYGYKKFMTCISCIQIYELWQVLYPFLTSFVKGYRNKSKIDNLISKLKVYIPVTNLDLGLLNYNKGPVSGTHTFGQHIDWLWPLYISHITVV